MTKLTKKYASGWLKGELQMIGKQRGLQLWIVLIVNLKKKTDWPIIR